ncbi:MAG: flagellar hook capping FlgD N-terminal domain-containing protein [Tissierellaceae bacterium]|nr:flagellar hook capping FlgD N-terminal domain-containing protein [Tissierellaceae bacterium]
MEIRNYAASTLGVDNTSKNAGSKDLSVNDFLQIMAAEIKNQTPFGGGDSGGSKTDYLSQMAQFTSLEQMGEIIENLNVLSLMNQQQYTFSLIGKEVTVMDGEEEITGIVDKVKFENGYAVIQVNDKSYNLGSILEVTNPEVSK